jgi:N-methylhydantoinase A
VLGYLNPIAIAGGTVKLNAARAHKVLQDKIAGPAGLDLEAAAGGVLSIAAATMMRAVKAVSTYRGRDPRAFTLFAFGGNGPLVAAEVAGLLEMRKVVVPPAPGVFSALGLLYSQTRREQTRTIYRPVADIDPADLASRLTEVQSLVAAALAEEGCPPEAMGFQIEGDFRYVGQAYELSVRVSDSALLLTEGPARFHDEHEQTYGHADREGAVELVNIRVVGLRMDTANRRFTAPALASVSADDHPTREVWFSRLGRRVTTPIITRADLVIKAYAGPVIIEEYDSTTVVPPGWSAALDVHTNIVLTQEA